MELSFRGKLMRAGLIGLVGASVACQPEVKRNPVSPVIVSYTQEVSKDIEKQMQSFNNAGTKDLSGNGYPACVVDPDCLGGQSCVAGTTPNTPQMPGYCVEKPEK